MIRTLQVERRVVKNRINNWEFVICSPVPETPYYYYYDYYQSKPTPEFDGRIMVFGGIIMLKL